jgi:archaetidylinositol phosphate synthase
MTEFREAERAQESFLAPAEKKALIWMARRTPRRIGSDHLSALGLASLAGAGLSYWAARREPEWLLAAIVFLALNWLGDSLDGTLARVRNQQRPRYGFYIDHIIDAAGTLFLLWGLGLSGYMSPAIAAGLLIIYYLLSIETYLATYTLGTFHISFWKFSPTELRILLAIGNIAAMLDPVAHLGGYDCLLFDAGGAVGIAGMALMATTAAVKHAAALYRAEPLPRDVR